MQKAGFYQSMAVGGSSAGSTEGPDSVGPGSLSATEPTAPVQARSDLPFNRGPEQGEETWTHDIFGCFHDYRICIFTFVAPCYTIGRNAHYLGEDGVVIGIFYTVFFFAFGPMMRWRIRERRNIRGSMLGDAVLHFVCPWCALVQENKELYGGAGSHLGEKIPILMDIQRH